MIRNVSVTIASLNFPNKNISKTRFVLSWPNLTNKEEDPAKNKGRQKNSANDKFLTMLNMLVTTKVLIVICQPNIRGSLFRS